MKHSTLSIAGRCQVWGKEGRSQVPLPGICGKVLQSISKHSTLCVSQGVSQEDFRRLASLKTAPLLLWLIGTLLLGGSS